MDRLTLAVDLSCLVGILPRERVEPQPIRVEITLELDLEGVGATGDLARGVDYAAVDEMVRFVAVEGRFRLIESLALALSRLLVRAPVERATVRIAKPAVLRAALPAIELSRARPWADEIVIDLPEVQLVRAAPPDADAVTTFAGEPLAVRRRT